RVKVETSVRANRSGPVGHIPVRRGVATEACGAPGRVASLSGRIVFLKAVAGAVNPSRALGPTQLPRRVGEMGTGRSSARRVRDVEFAMSISQCLVRRLTGA